MKATKTIQGGAVNLTKAKKETLNQDCDNLRKYLQGKDDVDILSQQATGWEILRRNQGG